MIRWRPETSRRFPGDACDGDEAIVARRSRETMPGGEPCSGLRCSSREGARCSYMDRRGRRCKTAWCPVDRTVVAGRVYCTLHAHAMRGLDWEFGSASHPDVDSRTVPVIQWISAAVADEIIETLNVFCAVNGEVLVAEPVRRMFNPVAHTRVWEKQWKTLSQTGVTLRVSVSADEERPAEIHIKVNGQDISVLPPLRNQELSAPTADDLRWLDEQVVVPVVAAATRHVLEAAERGDEGYVPPPEWAARDHTRSVTRETVLDGERRAVFLHGAEEVVALGEAQAARC